jgi:hypothetical protein
MKSSDFLQFLKTEAFLISALPAVAVVISFFFEVGYLKFYGVPVGVVEIDIYKIIISVICLVAFFYSVVKVFYLVLGWADRGNKFVSIFWVSMLPALLVALISFLYRLYFLLWFAVAIWFFCYLYVWVLMGEREKNKKDVARSDGYALADKINGFVFMSVLAAGLSFGVGYNVALDKVSYFVVGGKRILVEVYGGRAVLANFVEKDGGIFLTGEIEVSSLDDYKMKGKFKRFGEIKPAEILKLEKD